MSSETINIQESLKDILAGENDQQIVDEIGGFGYPVTNDENLQFEAIEEFTGYSRTDPEFEMSKELLRAVKITSKMPQQLPSEVISPLTIHWARALGALQLLSSFELSERVHYIDQIVSYFRDNTQGTPADLMSHISQIENAITLYEDSVAC